MRWACTIALLVAACGEPAPIDSGPGPEDASAPGDAGRGLDATLGRDAGAINDAGEGADAGLPPLRDDAVEPGWTWTEQVRRRVDRTRLADAFASAGYALPSGAAVYAVRIVDGVDQPAFEPYEAGLGAFDASFWPASTIKLLSSVAALEFAGARGFTGAARMTWDSGYNDDLSAIIDRAIRDSSNPDYDRTLRVAGLDWINTAFLVPERDLGVTVLTSAYGGLPVRDVSGLTMSEDGRTDYVSARTTTGDYGRNDTDLFELGEGIRRVLLHREIPAAHRFAIADADVDRLRDALCGSTVKYFRPGARAVLGADAISCNKYGLVPSADCLDTALLERADGSERYVLAATVPADACNAQLAEIAERTLAALRGIAPRAPLQLDAGVAIVVQRDDLGSDGAERALRFTVDAPGADDVDVTFGRGAALATAPVVGTSGRFMVERSFGSGGERLLIVRARAAGVDVGYRALRMVVPAP